MNSEANGDQYYNKIKVVEVNSVLDELKDGNTSYDQAGLRCQPPFGTNFQSNTYVSGGFHKRSLLGMSPDAHFTKTRRVLSQIEECLL